MDACDYKCPRCNGNVFKHGFAGSSKTRYECKDCGFRTTSPLSKDEPSVVVQKYAIFPDTHAPYENKRVIAAACEYMELYKPDHIIHLGDVGDFKSISHWMKNKRLELEGLTISDDLESACGILKTFASVAPNATKTVLLGNHDQWVYNYVNEHPELHKTINVTTAYESVGWNVIPWNQLYKIGKLYLTHGLYTNLYHAAKTVHSLSASVMYGHTHDDQKHTVSFIDGEKSAGTPGCMCDMNPGYLENRPKRWVNGFATADILPNGNFFPDYIKVIDGKFCRVGRVYGK